MAIQTIPAATAGGGLEPKYQKFTSSGTFTLPTGYGISKPLLVNILVIGGGGGGSGATNNTATFDVTWSINANQYFGQTGGNATKTMSHTPKPGGSGGIAATQMYLTENLTITVGAAGTRTTNTVGASGNWNSGTDNSGNAAQNQNTSWVSGPSTPTVTLATAPGGTGGTTTAGSISSTGGAGATQNYAISRNLNDNYRSAGFSADTFNFTGNSAVGTGGTPAGTAGDAIPLLGTIAGGSSSGTSVKGSFGIGGVLGDAGTSTGVEGTGGGAQAIAAPGAVILTWWE